jgi:hypothetical protein
MSGTSCTFLFAALSSPVILYLWQGVDYVKTWTMLYTYGSLYDS